MLSLRAFFIGFEAYFELFIDVRGKSIDFLNKKRYNDGNRPLWLSELIYGLCIFIILGIL